MTGTLEDTTPAGVLQVLSSQHSTGAVRFLGDSGCTVYLHRGELYFAESDDTAEALAVALVRPGRLTAEQWDASTESGYPTETVGEALIDTGAVTRDLLASVVLSVIYDPLIQLFRAPEGAYEFTPDLVHWIGPYRTFSVDAIVSEVRRRTREADEMAPVVPSLDAVVSPARTLPENRGSVNLRRDDWEVVVTASPGRTVTELAAELGRGRWSTARIVYRLATADLLEVVPAAESTTTDPFAVGTGSSLASVPPVDTDEVSSPDDVAVPAVDADADTDAAVDEPTVNPGHSYGFEAVDAPPPLDDAVLSPGFGDASTPTTDPWSVGGTADDFPSTGDWSTPEPASGDDPWGEFDRGSGDSADDWNPAALYGDADDGDGPATDDSWSGGLTAVPDPVDDGDFGFGADPATPTDEPPALHPDIAKALAESTYADSATAINAMAARLGAIDADDDDDWDTGDVDADGDDFWSDTASGSGEPDFIWKPAVWDTGVESAPLPHRESAMAHDGGRDGTGDPAWLNNLYSEFMPGGEQNGATGAAASAGEAAPAPPADAAPKQRTLKRLISAIRRL